MNNERMEELAALHAVGLLDDAGGTELLNAMDRDSAVERLVRDYDETAASMTFELPQIPPPPGLKNEILSQLSTPRRGSNPFHLSAWAPYAIAACLMLVATVQAVRIFALKAEMDSLRTQLTRLSESNAMMGLRLSSLESRDAAYQSSRIMVAWDPFQHRGVIAMQNLPAPAAGHNYQLWVLDPGAQTPISAGVIQPDKTSGSFTVKPLSTVSPGFAITLEPGEGSPAPTSAILFAVAPGQ